MTSTALGALPSGTAVLDAIHAVKNGEPETLLVSLPDSPYYTKYWEPPSAFTPAPPWERRRDLSPNTDALLAAIQPHVPKQIASVKMLGHGIFHMVYILTLDDGTELVSRVAFNYKTDTSALAWTERKMRRELAVLRLLARAAPAKSAIPRVVHCDYSPRNVVGSPYMIMERLPGVGLGRGHTALLDSMADQEAFVQSLAQTMVDIFNITLPRIGSVLELDAKGEPIVGPLLDFGETDYAIAEGPFDDIEQYLSSVITIASVRNYLAARGGPLDTNVAFEGLMNRLRDLAPQLVPKGDPHLMRVALVHTDTSADNFLIDGKRLSGLIDWETHAALPACLAARYPHFLRSDGMWDSRYASDEEMAKYPKEWPESPEDLQHLRAVFRSTTLKLCPEYVKALDEGERLRQLVEWTEFATWQGQVTWHGCDLWEKDMRVSLSVREAA